MALTVLSVYEMLKHTLTFARYSTFTPESSELLFSYSVKLKGWYTAPTGLSYSTRLGVYNYYYIIII